MEQSKKRKRDSACAFQRPFKFPCLPKEICREIYLYGKGQSERELRLHKGKFEKVMAELKRSINLDFTLMITDKGSTVHGFNSWRPGYKYKEECGLYHLAREYSASGPHWIMRMCYSDMESCLKCAKYPLIEKEFRECRERYENTRMHVF